MSAYNHISVAVPALAELKAMPRLIDCLRRQTFKAFALYVCVNNPDHWWTDGNPHHKAMADENMALIEYLNTINDIDITIIDKATPGHGWTGKHHGVGWARKLLLDTIAEQRGDDELIVSMDADTHFDCGYLPAAIEAMNNDVGLWAIAVPYYHPLDDIGSDDECRAILRYEIYMRYYMLQLMRIASPYAFTALGSAMVFSAGAYRRVGGITPLQGGEDFYLMQKLAKAGRISTCLRSCVYPSARASHRVPFGTGPAVGKTLDDQERSYPFYPSDIFDRVGQTFDSFPTLYHADCPTPMTTFLQQQLRTTALWQPMRANYKRPELFVRACAQRVDGLRILQYLRNEYAQYPSGSSTSYLIEYCRAEAIDIDDNFSFATTPIEVINALRNALFDKEMLLRR